MYVKIKPSFDHNYTLGEGTIPLKKDVEYVCHDSATQTIPVSFVSNQELNNYTIDIDANNKKILFMRGYSFGDILFLTPIIKKIKSKYPDVKIGFGINPTHHQLLSIISDIDFIENMPIEYDRFKEYDYHFTVSGVIDDSTNKNNVYDEYCKVLGCGDDEITKQPIISHQDISPITKNPNEFIGLHVFSNSHTRSYPLGLASILVEKLYKEFNKKIVVFSSRREFDEYKFYFNPEHVIWPILHSNNNDITEIIRFVKSCNFIISVDSFITHLSQAIGIKQVVLYGPFSSDSRVKYYKNITVIDTNPDCRCFENKCIKLYNNQCMYIDPDLIVKECKKYA